MKRSNTVFYNGWVFKLILINVVIFAIQVFTAKHQAIYSISGFNGRSSVITFYLGLIPALVVEKGFIWQIVSYMFLHSTVSFVHIFFNMYALLIFGVPIEQEWGSRRLLFYYFFCGIGAGMTIFIINSISQGIGYYIPTIGASGAVFGLLLAFGILFPNAEILLFFVLPVKAKYLVIIFGGLELFFEFSGGQGTISHIGHLGGLLAGLIYFFTQKRRGIKFKSKVMIAKGKKRYIANKSSEQAGKDRLDETKDEMKKNILKKLQQSGYKHLSDDEVQYIKYIEIMTDDEVAVCQDGDLNLDDEYCSNCDNVNTCFLREVAKYTEK
ncbi:MAG: rhomboid family intramembrane serine protease [Spirochaetota bacterium]|nr:rhomboid family intramembrane serine protease [Spirochaetota bacterium]